MKKVFALLTIALVLFAGCKKNKQKEPKPDNKPAPPAEVVAVDLGLSVLWADRNIGAATPEDPGYYFAWGESTVRSNSNFVYDYVFNDVEPPVKLTPEYDTATRLWGEGWRMPTNDEMRELFKLATEQIKDGEVIVGVKVTATNGNSIYFPDDPGDTVLAMRLWTSECAESDKIWAYCVNWPSTGISTARREYPHHVRAVKAK